MSVAIAFLERIGLLTVDTSDAFDLRLARIGRRERRLNDAPALFKNRLSPSEV